MPWIYVESFGARIRRHNVSKKGVATQTDFWHDLKQLDAANIRVVRADKAPSVSIKVFQNNKGPVAEKPILWLYGVLISANEQDALLEATYVSRIASALVAVALGIPLQKGSELHLISVDESEHGWLPHFDGTKFAGIDVLQEPPTETDEGREYAARRTIPANTPIVGSITNEARMPLFLQDVVRLTVGDKKVDVGGLQFDIEEVDKGIEWLSKNEEQRGILLDCLEFYIAAVAEENPTLQFVLYWNIVEFLVNSTTTTRYLPKDDIKLMVGLIELDASMAGRVHNALANITAENYRDRVNTSFSDIFGDCLDDSAEEISKLRRLRGKILHPRDKTESDEQLVTALAELRQIIDAHIKLVRTRILSSR